MNQSLIAGFLLISTFFFSAPAMAEQPGADETTVRLYDFAAVPAGQIAALRAKTETQKTPQGRLTIRLYNYAKVPSATLRRAAEKARRIYQQAEVETEWTECRTSTSDPVKNPACLLYPGPTVLQLRILPRWMAESAPVSGNVFGYALPAREGEFSNVAAVFFHRVEQLSAETGTTEDVILGHILAHETGHLLLGFSSHSKRGIMHIPWRDDDLKRAEIGGLTFNHNQARAIQKEAAKRIVGEVDRASEITVRLYDFAGVPAREITRAQQEASEIFARSGVQLGWLTCTLNAQGRPSDPACNSVRGPAVVNLRLLPERMEPPRGLPEGIFGFSLMAGPGRFSTTALIYSERVSVIADGSKYRRGVVLGTMIAHELGHLLLGVNSHSKKGLMSLPWGPRALTAADRGMLSFSKRETRLLQQAAHVRNTQLAAVPSGFGR